MKIDYPVPFGLLDNTYVDSLPYSNKRIMADCFFRAWKFRQHRKGEALLIFHAYERGAWYKKYHRHGFLLKVMNKFEKIDYIRKIEGHDDFYEINITKFLNNRNM